MDERRVKIDISFLESEVLLKAIKGYVEQIEYVASRYSLTNLEIYSNKLDLEILEKIESAIRKQS